MRFQDLFRRACTDESKWDRFRRKHGLEEFGVFADKEAWSYTVLFLVTIMCLILIPLAIASIYSGRNYVCLFLESPTALFTFVTGTATLFGTYFTVLAVLDRKHAISSFPQLAERLTKLINRAAKSKEGVLFFAYTIQPGAWNVTEERYASFKQALTNPRVKIRSVCLSPSAHDAWLSKFINIQTMTHGTIKTERKDLFIKECEDILNCLAGRKSNCIPKDEGYRVEPVRLPYKAMPGFYFFVSAERAILAAPIGIPRIGNPPPGQQGAIEVEALGFETTDRRIVQMLRREFARYAEPMAAPSETQGIQGETTE